MKSVKRFLICNLILILLFIFMKNWYFDVYETDRILVKPMNVKTGNSKASLVENKITLVIRYIPDLSKYILGTVKSFLALFPQLSIHVVCDTSLDRRMLALLSNVSKLVELDILNFKLDLLRPFSKRSIEDTVKTEYILIVPIGTLARTEKTMLELIKILHNSNASALTVPVKNKRGLECLDLNLNLLQWTIEYKFSHFSSLCDAVKGNQVLLTRSKLLRRLPKPFILPFPESFYIQSSALKMKVKLLDNITFEQTNNLISPAYSRSLQIQRQLMYEKFKIKKVIRETGQVEWYGCSRDTYRCFGTVVDSIPDYLGDGRWTPPCCLRVLRETVRHVVKTLKEYNVTFWLEGGSLLGAMRNKDIIPWDYDVDIGMYLSDLRKCPWLKSLGPNKLQRNIGGVLDGDGFLWEKSNPDEGEFYRVHRSMKNRLHVDIFPFYPRNGTMTKRTWFPTHPQDKEFPEHYLQPLTTIEFAGIEVPAPNNIREFLEFKFGKGCVENPQYPNPKIFPFPEELRKFVIFNETKNYDV